MKTRWIPCGVALLGILGCAGCKDGNSLTDPAGLDLNGAWTGTMTHYGSPTCTREGVSVALTQQGGAVSGSLFPGPRARHFSPSIRYSAD
jgi:hypothetical protein